MGDGVGLLREGGPGRAVPEEGGGGGAQSADGGAVHLAADVAVHLREYGKRQSAVDGEDSSNRHRENTT